MKDKEKTQEEIRQEEELERQFQEKLKELQKRDPFVYDNF